MLTGREGGFGEGSAREHTAAAFPHVDNRTRVRTELLGCICAGDMDIVPVRNRRGYCINTR